MTKDNALTALCILEFLKLKPSASFTLDQLIETKKFGDRVVIVESLGYLVSKQAVKSKSGDSFWFNKDLDSRSLKELRDVGGVKVQRPKL